MLLQNVQVHVLVRRADCIYVGGIFFFTLRLTVWVVSSLPVESLSDLSTWFVFVSPLHVHSIISQPLLFSVSDVSRFMAVKTQAIPQFRSFWISSVAHKESDRGQCSVSLTILDWRMEDYKILVADINLSQVKCETAVFSSYCTQLDAVFLSHGYNYFLTMCCRYLLCSSSSPSFGHWRRVFHAAFCIFIPFFFGTCRECVFNTCFKSSASITQKGNIIILY